MFSAAATIGLISLCLLLGFTAWFLRQLGAEDVARGLLAFVVAGIVFAVAATLIL